MKRHTSLRSITPALLAVLAPLLSSCATNPVTGEQDFVLMSEQGEIDMGREYHQQVLEEYTRYDDPELQAYVQSIGQSLAQRSHRAGLTYHFHVLDSTEVNAFALPGGYIYISRGLIAYMNSEAELAAVLGHELGHVTARHSVRQHSAQTTTQLLGAVVAAGTGIQGAGDLTDLLGTALIRGYGREHELEADRLGAEYLARTGYDPEAMIQVIRILKNQELFERERAREEGRTPQTYHGLFSTHPDNDTRLHEVVSAANRFRTAAPAPDRREVFLGKIDGMTFGHGESEGVQSGNRFYHVGLDFGLTWPEGWRVSNLADRLVATSPDNRSELMLVLKKLEGRKSPKTFVRDELGLSLRNAQSLTINGLNAYAGSASGQQFSDGKARLITVILHHGHAFVFAATGTSARQLNQEHDRVMTVVRSFHPLSPAEKKKARPLVIDVIEARTGDNFGKLAARSPIPDHAEQQLRLLNDRYPTGDVKPGEKLKVVK